MGNLLEVRPKINIKNVALRFCCLGVVLYNNSHLRMHTLDFYHAGQKSLLINTGINIVSNKPGLHEQIVMFLTRKFTILLK